MSSQPPGICFLFLSSNNFFCVSGNIQTPLLDQSLEIQGGSVDMSAHAIKRVGTADEVAQLTLFLLSDASQYITGAVYNIDGGWS